MITIIRGDSVAMPISFKVNGAALSLTDKSILVTFRNSAGAKAIEKTITTHVDEAAGLSLINLSSTDTQIAAGRYKWDIVLIDGAVRNTVYLDFAQVTEGVSDV